MKKLWIIVAFLTIGTLVFSQKTTTKATTPKAKVLVYYFHGAQRCPTCLSIEANTKKTLETYFKKEVADKTIVFSVVDVDEAKNEKLAAKYEASGSALHVVQVVKGKEKDEDLTNFAFSYSRNEPEKFIKGLKGKISKKLAN